MIIFEDRAILVEYFLSGSTSRFLYTLIADFCRDRALQTWVASRQSSNGNISGEVARIRKGNPAALGFPLSERTLYS